MASVDIFSSATTTPAPQAIVSLSSSPMSTSPRSSPTIGLTDDVLPISISDGNTYESLSKNDIKLFESLELASGSSSGIGTSSEVIIEGSLEETDSLLDDTSRSCKICK